MVAIPRDARNMLIYGVTNRNLQKHRSVWLHILLLQDGKLFLRSTRDGGAERQELVSSADPLLFLALALVRVRGGVVGIPGPERSEEGRVQHEPQLLVFLEAALPLLLLQKQMVQRCHGQERHGCDASQVLVERNNRSGYHSTDEKTAMLPTKAGRERPSLRRNWVRVISDRHCGGAGADSTSADCTSVQVLENSAWARLYATG